MTFNHLVLIGGGHTNALLMRKWIMYPKLMPEIPISIISKDTHLVYSAKFPSVISKSISLDDSLIDIGISGINFGYINHFLIKRTFVCPPPISTR